MIRVGGRLPIGAAREVVEADDFHDVERRVSFDAFEVGAQLGRISFDDVEIPDAPALRRGRALAEGGDLDGALRVLAELVRDPQIDRGQRAHAAVLAGKLAHENDRAEAAEHFSLLADSLSPDLESAKRLRLTLRVGEKATSEVLQISTDLLEKHPEDLSLLRIRSSARLEDADPDGAVADAARAWALAKRSGNEKELVQTGGTYAFALTKANRADEAVSVLEECLALAPKDASLHRRIAEYVQPDFSDKPKRAEIKKHFTAANRAWQTGDDDEVKKLALKILALDARDGLAHHLYAVAHDRSRLRKLGLLHQIDEPKEQTALISQLENVCARAKVGGKPGRVEQLFPEWKELTAEQRGTIAYSVLGFAKVIPAILEKGTEFHFALPGTSLCEIDPLAEIEKKKAFGRMSYSGRGWAYHRKNRVYCGLERVDGAARGERNTVTHELAHVVHYHLRDLAEKRKTDGKSALSDEENVFADMFERVEALYAEARNKKDGQSLLDAYSGTNVWEYFAQGMMGYLAMTDRLKESAPRLYARNPKLWQTAAQLASRLAEFPELAPGPRPLPVSATDSGLVRSLHTLAEDGKKRHVVAQAKCLLDRLTVLLESDERPWKSRTGELALILARAEELVLVDEGTRTSEHFAEARAVLPLYDREALEGFVMQLLKESAIKNTRPPELLSAYSLAKRDQLDEARSTLISYLS